MANIIRAAAHGTVCAALAAALVAGAGPAPAASDLPVSFALDVKPILDSRCVQCHAAGGAGTKASGLDLTSYEGLMEGTRFGPIVVPGDPVSSNLNVLVEGRADPSVRMPHNQRPLLKAQQKILHDWVQEGAKNN
jgi:hypothetical protein